MANTFNQKLGSLNNDNIRIDSFTSEAFGFAGNDTYFINTLDGLDAYIIEAENQGTDTVSISVGNGFSSYALQENIENLSMLYYGGNNNPLTVLGNTLNNFISIDINSTILTNIYGSYIQVDGREGNDTIIGGSKNTFANLLQGGQGNDSLVGGAYRDYLDGGVGKDTMVGGDGDDNYTVDDAGDVIVESANEGGGIDSVVSYNSYTLSANIERILLSISSSTALNATGNASDNYVYGNSLNNVLLGLAGDDQIYGNNGNDTIDGGAGNDSLNGGSGSNTLKGGDGNDRLVSSSDGFADFFDGGAGDDTIESSLSGADTMVGGAGDDLFYRRDGDVVTEAVGGGIDTIYNYSSNGQVYELAANVENLVMKSGADARGNALNNRIEGNNNNNLLEGLAGDDILLGGYGSDTMKGGAGNDIYYVTASSDMVTELVGEGTADTVISNVSYTLTTNVENLTLTGHDNLKGVGNDSANKIKGNDANNLLIGGKGDDTLDGADGTDTLSGGEGNDTYYVNTTTDIVTGELLLGGTDTVISSGSFTLGLNIENLTLTFAGIAKGNDSANKIVGSTGNDTIDGGKGADSMEGGKGDDTYYVGQSTDVVKELSGEGTDKVFSSLNTYTLGANFENLTFSQLLNANGVGGVNGKGNELNNFITSYNGDDTLDGAVGNDSISSGSGDDSVTGGAGNDTLIAGVGTDTLDGGAGNDILDGGAGNDSMKGGAGDDVYYVDSALDAITEGSAEGTADSVFAQYTDYTLSANIENITLLDFANFQLPDPNIGKTITGNAISNLIVSLNNDADTLIGGAGNDTLNGGDGADNMNGGDGNDTYILSNETDQTVELATANAGIDTVLLNFGGGTYTLSDNIENATRNVASGGLIKGNAAKNLIIGNTQNDQIDTSQEGSEADTLQGGAGDDVYRINFSLLGNAFKTNDVITENANQGFDKVRLVIDDADILTGTQALTTYTLANNVERVEVDGIFSIAGSGTTYANTALNFNITANALDNTVYGSLAKNLILGLAGNDDIHGAAGEDTLDGGDGNDNLDGGLNNDKLFGGAGNDVLFDGGYDNNSNSIISFGTDTLTGGAGDDAYYIDDSDTVVELSGGGKDTAFISILSPTPVTIDLKSTQFGSGQLDNLTVYSAQAAVTVLGNSLDNVLSNNTSQSFTLNGDAGKDTLSDGFFFSDSNKTDMSGGEGNDTFESWHLSSSDSFDGGNGTDILNAYLSTYSDTTVILDTTSVERLNLQYFDDFADPGIKTVDLTGDSFANGISVTNAGSILTRGNIDLKNIANNQVLEAKGYIGILGLDGVVDNQAITLNVDGGGFALKADGSSQIKTINIGLMSQELTTIDVYSAYVVLTDIQVTGDGALSLVAVDSSQVTTLNNMTGSLDLDAYFENTIHLALNNSAVLLSNPTNGESLEITTLGASASQVDLLNYQGSVTVTGTQSLVVTNAHGTLDASELTLPSGSAGLTVLNASSSVNITGSSKADAITGSSSNDTILSGSGADTLTGGGGTDTFIFNGTVFDGLVTISSDVITDWDTDFLQFDHNVFTNLSFNGATVGNSSLSAGELFYGTLDEFDAAESSANLVYDQSTGALYYDDNGAAGLANSTDALLLVYLRPDNPSFVDSSYIVYG